jgi:hypothetical protein
VIDWTLAQRIDRLSQTPRQRIVAHVLNDRLSLFDMSANECVAKAKDILDALDELAMWPGQSAPMADLHETAPTVLTAAQQIRLETVRMVLDDLQATVGDGAEGAYTLRNLVSDVLLVARVIETGQEPLPAPRVEPVPPVQADGTADEEAAR